MLCLVIVETDVRNNPGPAGRPDAPCEEAQLRPTAGGLLPAALLPRSPLGQTDLVVQEIDERDPLGLERLRIK